MCIHTLGSDRGRSEGNGQGIGHEGEGDKSEREKICLDQWHSGMPWGLVELGGWVGRSCWSMERKCHTGFECIPNVSLYLCRVTKGTSSTNKQPAKSLPTQPVCNDISSTSIQRGAKHAHLESWRLKQEDTQIKDNLGYTVRLCLKNVR